MLHADYHYEDENSQAAFAKSCVPNEANFHLRLCSETQGANPCAQSYCAVKKIFCKNYVQKRWKTTQESEKSQIFSKTSKRFQLLPNASECIPMGPNGSESLEKLAKTSKNLRKLWNISQKLRKTSRKILQKLFSRRIIIFLMWFTGQGNDFFEKLQTSEKSRG